MTTQIENNQKNEELSQAIARLVISSIVVVSFISLIIAGQQPNASAVNLGVASLVFSAIWVVLIARKPGSFPFRRYIAIISDITVVSLAIHLLDDWGGILYALYLWVILGNGMRFGQYYLRIAYVLGVIGFSLVLFYTPYWHGNLALSSGLLLGIIVLPLFYATLIGRLHNLNEKLSVELDRSTFAATHDGMTSLVNRSYFVKRLEEEIQRSTRYGNMFCVIYIDLDDFKFINDNYGHLQGDAVIIELADRLNNTIRKTDIAARMGGDEFAMILLSMEVREDIENFSRKLVKNLSQPIQLGSFEYKPSASVGVSVFPSCGDTVNDLIVAADKAMYISKSKGKNTYCISKKFLENSP